ncbi:hypothetical protein FLAVO9AF_100146 [Flavobacterium sp. 9AF]|nr:hypothetical protein FLAVO9AF_100146 [Flavobacterium sp. 9AF]
MKSCMVVVSMKDYKLTRGCQDVDSLFCFIIEFYFLLKK